MCEGQGSVPILGTLFKLWRFSRMFGVCLLYVVVPCSLSPGPAAPLSPVVPAVNMQSLTLVVYSVILMMNQSMVFIKHMLMKDG